MNQIKAKILVGLTVVAAVAAVAAASVTHNIVQSYQTAAGSLTGTTVVTSDTEHNTDITLPSAVTNSRVNLTITRSQIQSLCLFSSVYTWVSVNSTSAPANTFLLAPAAPQIGTGTNALSLAADVSSLWLSCTNTNGGTLSLRAVLHTTVP
jgi:hypothetical protein